MAGVKFCATTAEIATGTSAKTVLQLVAASNHRVLISRLGIYFDGTSATAEPIQVRILRQTTAGTMSSLALVKLNSADDETLQTTAQHTATVEPTAGDVLSVAEVHPQGGYEVIFPQGWEIIMPGGTRLGVEVTAPAAVNTRVVAWGEE